MFSYAMLNMYDGNRTHILRYPSSTTAGSGLKAAMICLPNPSRMASTISSATSASANAMSRIFLQRLIWPAP